MWYLTLLVGTFVLYTPPFNLVSLLSTWCDTHPLTIGWSFLSLSWGGGSYLGAILIAAYIVVAAGGAAIVRYLVRTEKPPLLRQLCAPDRAGGLDLVLMLCGFGILALQIALVRTGLGRALNIHLSAALVTLGIVAIIGIRGHAREMNAWQYDDQEMRRRIVLRGR